MSRRWSRTRSSRVVLEHHLFRPRLLRGVGRGKAPTSTNPSPVDRRRGRAAATLISGPSTWIPRWIPKGAAARWSGCSTAWCPWVPCRRKARRPGGYFGDRLAGSGPGPEPAQTGQSHRASGHQELLDLFSISEQQLNTEGLRSPPPIDPRAQRRPGGRHRHPRGSGSRHAFGGGLDRPEDRGGGAYFGGTDANGFDFAQAGLPTGSSFKVFALIAAFRAGAWGSATW